MDMTNVEKCRLIGDELYERDMRVIWRGERYAVDRRFDFVVKHKLPKIARVVSPAGRVFDIYRGYSESAFGGVYEFASAVEIAHLI